MKNKQHTPMVTQSFDRAAFIGPVACDGKTRNASSDLPEGRHFTGEAFSTGGSQARGISAFDSLSESVSWRALEKY